MFNFYISQYGRATNNQYADGSLILSTDPWDDFGFETKFHMYYMQDKARLSIGEIKIGFIGQQEKLDRTLAYESATRKIIPQEFQQLDKQFFSLGQSSDFYETLYQRFGQENTFKILQSLNDVSIQLDRLNELMDETVFTTSLLRSIDEWQIPNQFAQIIQGRPKLDNYDFVFMFKNNRLLFHITALSNPPSNMHAVIGKNGVGKTTLLNAMLASLISKEIDNPFSDREGKFSDGSYTDFPLEKDYFSKIIYISYSIFGQTVPDTDNKKLAYLGLKQKIGDKILIKDISSLFEEFQFSLGIIQSSQSLSRLLRQVLPYFASSYEPEILDKILATNPENKLSEQDFSALSSGHSIVLLIVVNLIANVIEKTLVLFDEPEIHLHPPLLSALVRAVNDIVIKKNGVCIFATHSPVVLQEIPANCVHIIHREGDLVNISRPPLETFGENVSRLTHEVFGLEIRETGFYHLLTDYFATKNGSAEAVIQAFGDQLGSEAVGLLYSLDFNQTPNNLEWYRLYAKNP